MIIRPSSASTSYLLSGRETSRGPPHMRKPWQVKRLRGEKNDNPLCTTGGGGDPGAENRLYARLDWRWAKPLRTPLEIPPRPLYIARIFLLSCIDNKSYIFAPVPPRGVEKNKKGNGIWNWHEVSGEQALLRVKVCHVYWSKSVLSLVIVKNWKESAR